MSIYYHFFTLFVLFFIRGNEASWNCTTNLVNQCYIEFANCNDPAIFNRTLCNCYLELGQCLFLTGCSSTIEFQEFQNSCKQVCVDAACWLAPLECTPDELLKCNQIFLNCYERLPDRDNENKEKEDDCECFATWGNCFLQYSCQGLEPFEIFVTTCMSVGCAAVCPFFPPTIAAANSLPSLSCFWFITLITFILNLTTFFTK